MRSILNDAFVSLTLSIPPSLHNISWVNGSFEMNETQTTVATEHASRDLQQLCKHWSHKMDVRFDQETGEVTFPNGARLLLNADQENLALTLRCEENEVERLETVVADHITRFAFRETLSFHWNRTSS